MGEVNVTQFLGVVGILATAVSAILVAMISKIKSPGETGAVKASTLSDLVASVETMGNALDKERSDRLEDCIKFEKQVAELKSHYELTAEETRRRNSRELREMRAYYEGKILRIEQAHRDRVLSLKQRISALEAKNGD